MLLILALLTGHPPPEQDKPYYLKSRPTAYLHVLDGIVYKGRISEAGDFVPLAEFKPRPLKNFVFSGSIRFLRAGKSKEPVYEYRCGRLVPGVLEKDAFIPDLDGKVMEFKTYRCTATARRIYNLPGKFVTKDGYEELKAAGELTEEDIEFNKDR